MASSTSCDADETTPWTFPLSALAATTDGNTGSASDTDFDRNEALFIGTGAANTGIVGTFAYSGVDGSVITGDYVTAFQTAQGDCDLEGNALVSS